MERTPQILTMTVLHLRDPRAVDRVYERVNRPKPTDRLAARQELDEKPPIQPQGVHRPARHLVAPIRSVPPVRLQSLQHRVQTRLQQINAGVEFRTSMNSTCQIHLMRLCQQRRMQLRITFRVLPYNSQLLVPARLSIQSQQNLHLLPRRLLRNLLRTLSPHVKRGSSRRSIPPILSRFLQRRRFRRRFARLVLPRETGSGSSPIHVHQTRLESIVPSVLDALVQMYRSFSRISTLLCEVREKIVYVFREYDTYCLA